MDEVSQVSQPVRSKSIIYIAVALISIIIAGLGFYFLYWRNTPEYSLQVIAKAIRTHDLATFEKYVDMDSLISRAIDQTIDAVTNNTEDQNPNIQNMFRGFAQMVKPMLIANAKEEIKSYIEKGNFDSGQTKPQDKTQKIGPDINIGEKYINPGGDTPQFKGIDYTKKDGKIAVVGLKLYYPKFESDVILEIKMRERDGYWQATEISNLKDFLTNIEKAKHAYYSSPPHEVKPLSVLDREYKDEICTLKYPQVEVAGNKEAQDKINEFIQDQIKKRIQRGKEIGQAEKLYESRRLHYFLKLDYKIYLNDGKLISLIFNDSSYTGGAHGSYVRNGFTFDAKTGNILEWADFYPPMDEHLRTVINNTVLQQIKEKKIPIFTPFSGIEVGKVPTFYVNENRKPVIIFQPYEIAPFSSGILEFELEL
ncbi:MAG TPA: DUF3298 and DUF4163 domain-containing protein [Selenomonadales bacterium]|nr:DUF3298 and DUF4163 domain-containing protein [Selenomonadales bacterium]